MPPVWTKSLRFQLTAWYLAALAVVLLMTAGTGYWLVRASLQRETDRALALAATQTLRQISAGDPAAVVSHPTLMPFALPGIGTDALALRLESAVTGQPVALSDNLAGRGDLRAALAAMPSTPHGPTFAGHTDEDQLRCLTVAVPRTPYLLQVAAPWDPMEDLLARLLLGLSLASLLFLLLSGIGSWLLVGRALRPIDHIVTETEGLTVDHLTPALLLPRALSDNEIGRLVDAVNRMLTRLAATFTAQRQFTADASHELRTPLTILRGEIELALSRERSATEYRRVLESGLEETVRLTHIVESLAFLARGDANQASDLDTSVSLSALVHEIATALARPAEAKSLNLILDMSDATLAQADADALRRMTRNLLENAIAYTPPGGQITLTTSANGHECRLVVADTGIGIAPEDLPHVFDRFFRADKARVNTGGSGLGLSIVQSIVAVHQGHIKAESEPGHGSRFIVTLPQDEKTLIQD